MVASSIVDHNGMLIGDTHFGLQIVDLTKSAIRKINLYGFLPVEGLQMICDFLLVNYFVSSLCINLFFIIFYQRII